MIQGFAFAFHQDTEEIRTGFFRGVADLRICLEGFEGDVIRAISSHLHLLRHPFPVNHAIAELPELRISLAYYRAVVA